MNGWVKLHEAHEALRVTGGGAVQRIRVLFAELIRRGHLDPTIQGRFTWEAEGPARAWRIAPPRARKAEERWSEPLARLATGVETAGLTVLARTDSSNTRLLALSAMVTGRSVAGIPFVIAAHLDERPRGDGACGHALFHCHVGPSLDDLPKVRVPMPALTPIEVVEWVLTPVLQGWEPETWTHLAAAVQARMEPTRERR